MGRLSWRSGIPPRVDRERRPYDPQHLSETVREQHAEGFDQPAAAGEFAVFRFHGNPLSGTLRAPLRPPYEAPYLGDS
jgi:hypothetical protein